MSLDNTEHSPDANSAPLEVQATTLPEQNEPSAGADEAGLLAVPESDDEEHEIDGEKYRLPKKLVGHLKELERAGLREDDYTRKTQSVAEKLKEVETRGQQLAAREQFQQQHVQAVAEVISIDKRLEQFAKLDWDAITDADPVQAQKLDRQMRSLQLQRNQIVGGIEQAQTRWQSEMQQATARQLQTAASELAREIKGFGTPEVAQQLIESGKKNGYMPEELAGVKDPRAIRLLHKAYLYDKLVADKTTEAKPKAAEVKPITRVAPGAAVVRKSISDPGLGVNEYIRLRNEQRRKK